MATKFHLSYLQRLSFPAEDFMMILWDISTYRDSVVCRLISEEVIKVYHLIIDADGIYSVCKQRLQSKLFIEIIQHYYLLFAEELGTALGLPQAEKASSASCASASTTDDRDSPQGKDILPV